jgi:hypothetical protein
MNRPPPKQTIRRRRQTSKKRSAPIGSKGKRLHLTLPADDSPPSTVADWLEFAALGAADNRASLSSISGGYDMLQDSESSDWSDADALADQRLDKVIAELNERGRILGEDYPFTVDQAGQFLHYLNAPTQGGSVYLFCLFLSHATKSAVLPGDALPNVTNDVRDLFQVSSTFAAAGYVEGVAVSFGWPRPNRSSFAEALKSVYEAFGDGTPRKRPLPGTPSGIKDGGIDIIAWRPSLDGLPGTTYLLGQVASGRNWKQKSVVEDSRLFHWAWFDKAPATERQHAMFIPFCLEPEFRRMDQGDEIDRLRDYLQVLTVQFGVVFYRYRLAAFAARGLQLHRRGVATLDRYEELPNIVEWVQIGIRRLRGLFACPA